MFVMTDSPITFTNMFVKLIIVIVPIGKVNYNLLHGTNGVFNPFVPNLPFLYPLKTSENLTVSWCVQDVERKVALGANGLTGFARSDQLTSW